MAPLPSGNSLDDWKDGAYATEKASNIAAADTATPTSDTTTGITFRGKTVRIPIKKTIATWKKQKEDAYDKLKADYRAKLINEWVRGRYYQRTIQGVSVPGSRTLGVAGSGTAYGGLTSYGGKGQPKAASGFGQVFSGEQRYKVRSQPENGYIYEGVLQLTYEQAANYRARGYTLEIVSNRVGVEPLMRVPINARTLQKGGRNWRGNTRVKREPMQPTFVGTKLKSELTIPRRRVR